MRKVIIVAAMLAILGVPYPARAESKPPNSVQELLMACEYLENPTAEQSGNYAYCAGIAIGVMGTLGQLTNFGEIKGKGYCISKDTSTGQLIQLFRNWAEANPKLWQYEGVSGFVVAATRAWPCQ